MILRVISPKNMSPCWMMFYPQIPNNATTIVCDVLFIGQVGVSFNQFPAIVAYQIGSATPNAFILQEGVPQSNSLTSTLSYVTFPQEEILFGREVTIDAIYISLWANLSRNVTINFLFNGVHFGALALVTGAPLNTLNGVPTNFKVFPDATVLSGTGVFNSQSPQLQITIAESLFNNQNPIRIAKIQLYASFEPKQRPV